MDVLPDVPTLRLCSILASGAFAGVFLVLWQGQRREAFWLHWTGASALYVVTLLVFAVAWNEAVVAGAYALLVVSMLLTLTGVRSFDGQAPVRGWMALLPFVAAAAYALPALLVTESEIATRLSRIGATAVMSCATALTGASLAFAPPPRASRGRRIAGFALLGYLPGYMLAMAGESAGWSQQNMTALVPMLSDQILLGVLNLGLLAIPGERAQAALRETALRDALTGAWNRAGLEARRGAIGPGAAVLLIDIDHFKTINDRHGHGAGDHVLVRLAAAAGALLPDPRDMLVRLGGDEFAILLQAASPAQARWVAEALVRAAREDRAGPAWTVSLGIAAVDERGADDAFARADAALYAAKAAGRNQAAA